VFRMIAIYHTHKFIRRVGLTRRSSNDPKGLYPVAKGQLRTVNRKPLLSGEAFGEVVAQELGDIPPQNLIAVGVEMNLVVLKKRDYRLLVRPE
jgi:hypothetical protein